MQLRVRVGATISDDDNAIIGVRGMEHGGQNYAAGGDAPHDERINILRAQDHFQVCASKSVDAVFGDNDVVRFGSDHGMNRSSRALKKFLMLGGILDGVEQGIAGADFRKTGTKTNLNMDNPHPR